MNNKNIEPDKALVDIKHDALDVGDLAKRIAASIVRMTSNEGLVVGLYGAWGSGKTTFINFIKQSFSAYEEKEQPVVLDFNPWLFSGHEDLIQRYIIELSKTLAPKRHKLKQWRVDIARGVENFTAVSRELLVFAASLQGIPMVADSVKALNALSEKAVKQLSEQPPLSQQKQKIENLLRGSKRKILVIIDDIDRLESREVMDIFRMVKSVADFPNVIYLLSFDKKLVSNIVKDFQNADGNEYLEKIVQYDIDLPYPSQSGILSLFGERIDPAIEASGGKKWNKDRWSKLYNVYLSDKLRTPRQAIRLSNAFNIGYPYLRGEVDPVDFLAIESLRMFNPDLYYELRRNSHHYTELGQMEYDAKKTDPPYFEKIIKQSADNEQDSIKEYLALLFPRVGNAFSNFIASTNDISEWRADGRVCSSHHFNRYFSYGIRHDEFSDAEILQAVHLTSDINQFESLIISYSKDVSRQDKSRIPDFLERFLDIVKVGRANEYLSNIIKNFLILGDLIVRKEDADRLGFTRIDSDMRILWIINSALGKIAPNLIFEIVKEAFEETKSIHISTKIFFYLAREHGLYGQKKDTMRLGETAYLTEIQVKELESIILSKIRTAAKDNSLIENVNLISILYRWRDFFDSFDEPKKWAQKVCRKDDNLKTFLIRFSGVSTISDMRGTTEKIYVRSEDVSNFLDLDSTAIRVKKLLADENLSGKERVALEAFINSYESKKNGKSDDFD